MTFWNVSNENSNRHRCSASRLGRCSMQHRFRAVTFLSQSSQWYLLFPSRTSASTNELSPSSRFRFPCTLTVMVKKSSSRSRVCSQSCEMIWLVNRPPNARLNISSASVPLMCGSSWSTSELKNSFASSCCRTLMVAPFSLTVRQKWIVSTHDVLDSCMYANNSCSWYMMFPFRSSSDWSSSIGAFRIASRSCGIMYSCWSVAFM